jgi:hypothetical protein
LTPAGPGAAAGKGSGRRCFCPSHYGALKGSGLMGQ